FLRSLLENRSMKLVSCVYVAIKKLRNNKVGADALILNEVVQYTAEQSTNTQHFYLARWSSFFQRNTIGNNQFFQCRGLNALIRLPAQHRVSTDSAHAEGSVFHHYISSF